jgi:lipopolysaccharide/colanic/teichoic acid biosynthesis glycosyltransferase
MRRTKGLARDVAEVRSQGPRAQWNALEFETSDWSPPPRPAALWLKHAIDRVIAACGLLVTAPLLAGVALALRLRGSGEIVRRHERLGELGRPIVVRSFAVTDGLCLRSRAWRIVAGSGLTALPQLWSVLRGEMSVIGPRPRDIGSLPPPMRPGLTGLAQLEQLERWLSTSEQLRLDDEYARTWSLALDARIVWRTMWCVLR